MFIYFIHVSFYDCLCLFNVHVRIYFFKEYGPKSRHFLLLREITQNLLRDPTHAGGSPRDVENLKRQIKALQFDEMLVLDAAPAAAVPAYGLSLLFFFSVFISSSFCFLCV
jgi:hypothetical protein